MSHQGDEQSVCAQLWFKKKHKNKTDFDAYLVVRGHISEPGMNKRLHNEFSLGITRLNQLSHLICTHAIEERVFLFMSCCAHEGWPARSHG